VVRDLLIAGAGGLARETASSVAAINAISPQWTLRGFLDDDPALHGASVSGVPVLGPLSVVHDHPDAAVVVCIASPRNPGVRGLVTSRLGLAPERYATIVHPSASVGTGCSVGPGTVLLAQTVLTADVRVGTHVAVMPQVVLTHDDVIGDFVTIASGVRVSGGVEIAEAAYLGTGALIRESLRIGARSIVGMGSVLLRDVPGNEVWAGNPARLIRFVNELQGSSRS
jgi:sugar O-acyltransferase (sialic acid O-acetyltransferase NeuD family)